VSESEKARDEHVKSGTDELFRYASVVRLGGTGFLGGSLAEGAFWDFF